MIINVLVNRPFLRKNYWGIMQKNKNSSVNKSISKNVWWKLHCNHFFLLLEVSFHILLSSFSKWVGNSWCCFLIISNKCRKRIRNFSLAIILVLILSGFLEVIHVFYGTISELQYISNSTVLCFKNLYFKIVIHLK